ncbi:MAG TPA: glycosyltransferase family 4 protein [Longimicrobium sp.]|jgi:glycosyltransferase involved in cell wall biosynthesis
MTRPRIAFVTTGDARGRSAWSGIPFYMARALERHVGSVGYIGPLSSPSARLHRLRHLVQRATIGTAHPQHHRPSIARDYARIARRRLGGYDVVFAVAASEVLAELETELPVVYVSDSTVRSMRDYYPQFREMSPAHAAQADAMERRSLERADRVMYPSEWAAASARDDYGVAPEKIFIAPFGANLDAVPAAEGLAARKSEGECRLLLLGVDWTRKGGDTALQVVEDLRRTGLDARLVVCGCVPARPVDAEVVRVIPRLDKSDPAQAAALTDLLLRSHFLLLPTRQECFGAVFCEAAGHGTPSLATDTGGVASAVIDQESGFLFPPDAPPSAYAATIRALMEDRPRYEKLVSSSRRAYDERLNWDAWARTAARVIEDVLA